MLKTHYQMWLARVPLWRERRWQWELAHSKYFRAVKWPSRGLCAFREWHSTAKEPPGILSRRGRAARRPAVIPRGAFSSLDSGTSMAARVGVSSHCTWAGRLFLTTYFLSPHNHSYLWTELNFILCKMQTIPRPFHCARELKLIWMCKNKLVIKG